MSFIIQFYLRKKSPKKNGECPIYLRVYIGKNYWINLKEQVDPVYWNDKKGNPIKKSHPNEFFLNRKLNEEKAKLEQIAYKLEFEFGKLDFQRLKNHYEGGDHTDFIKLCEEKIRLESKTDAHDTYRSKKSRLNRLKEFSPELYIKDIDYNFIILYKDFLINEKGNTLNSANMKLRFIKENLNKAEREGIRTHKPFDKYKIKYDEVKKPTLEPEEVKILLDIYNKEILPNHLQNVLHVFLLACYFGFRFGDYKYFKELKPDSTVTITQSKTNHQITFRIPEEANVLLNREVSLIKNQPFNRHLKEIMKTAGINKNASSHMARHTLATMLVNKGHSVLEVQAVLGHKTYKTTLGYAKINGKNTEKIMKGISYE